MPTVLSGKIHEGRMFKKMYLFALLILSLPSAGFASLLHEAAGRGNLAEITLLLATGEDVNAVDEYGYTALHWAAWNGNLAVVIVLLNARIMVNAVDLWGHTPLRFAAMNGYPAIVTSLLSAGAYLTIKNYYDESPLHKANRAVIKAVKDWLWLNLQKDLAG